MAPGSERCPWFGNEWIRDQARKVIGVRGNVRVATKRRGFTLVEILVVISIMIILVGLIATTARVGLNYANASATRVLIDSLDTAIEEKMKAYYANNLSSPNITPYQILAGFDPLTMQADPNNPIGQRAAVLARLDSLRSAFPQSFSEIVPNQSLVDALRSDNHAGFRANLDLGLNRLIVPSSAEQNSIVGTATAPLLAPDPAMQSIMIEYLVASKRIMSKAEFTATVDQFPNPNTQRLGGYANIVPNNQVSWSAVPHLDGQGNPRTGITATGVHNRETESAECLYLILQKDPVIEGIGAKFIKDTDGDGLLEFVDSFGKPIKWYRHAPDLFAYWIEVTQQYKSSSTQKLDLVLDADQVFEPVGDNSYDSQNVLYDYQTANDWWANGGGSETFGPITAGSHKDLFEAFFGRLHRAYNRTNPPDYTAPIGSSQAELTIAGDPVTGRNTAQNVPRPYPFRSVIVSAGGDGEFGLYSEQNVATRAQENSIPNIYPALHMGIKGGRVEEDPDKRAKLLDNIFSVELQEGLRQ